ncbi:mitogen-activated protein kinase tyrosine protein phosphatase sdp1, partial [Cymbomonas tetramitiformis]
RVIGGEGVMQQFERQGRGDADWRGPRLLCHLTTPHVVIWSAVLASSAFPGLFPSRELFVRRKDGGFSSYASLGLAEGRRWRDGSVEQDLPLKEVAELFNVQFFIVAQTNPHIIPLLHFRTLLQSLPAGNLLLFIAKMFEEEFKMRCNQVKALMGSGVLHSLASLFSQPWVGSEGDVTIVAPTCWRRISRAIENLSEEEVLEFAAAGERAVWPHIAAIKCHCLAEMELHKCYAKLVKAHRERYADANGLDAMAQRGHIESKLPSWDNVIGGLESREAAPELEQLPEGVIDTLTGRSTQGSDDGDSAIRRSSIFGSY